jgi:quinol monooxygenase YgiN
MIKVVANNHIKPERVGEFLEVVSVLVEKTNSLDKGCMSYALYQDTSDPYHYTMLEEWEDETAIENHMKSQHAQELIPKMIEFSSKSGEVTMYKKAVG